MKRTCLFLIPIVLLTVGVQGSTAGAATRDRAPSFVEMQGFEAIDWPTDLTKHLDFSAVVWVRNVTGTKTTSYTVTFTATFDTGSPVVRTNRLAGVPFGSATTRSPDDWNIPVPARATSVTVVATLTRTTTRPAATTVIDTMTSGPQRIYSMSELLATPPPEGRIFLVIAD